MPTVKISQLATILTAEVTGDDLIQIIDVGAATPASPGGINKKITTLGLANGLAAIQTTIPAVIQTALDGKQAVTTVSAAIFNIAAPVDVASTANNQTTGLFAGATVDGVTLVTGNRVLLKNQNIASQNGIWIVNGAAAAATRALDFDDVADISNGYVVVKYGTTNAGTSWVCNPISAVGESDIVFKQFGLYNLTSRITLGLENVDNTSDLDKPVSTLTQTALSGKQTTITGAASNILTANLSRDKVLISDADGKIASSAVTSAKLSYLGAVTSDVQAQLNLKAPLKNPIFVGNVGIGTIAPSTNLDVVGNVQVQGNNPRYILRAEDTNTADRIIDIDGVGPNANLRFYKQLKGTDPTQVYMTINSGGFVGIGTTTPLTKLQVDGAVTATSFAGDLTGNADTVTGITNQNSGNADLNTLTTSGFYHLDGSPTNIPTATFGQLLVMHGGSDSDTITQIITQILGDYSNGNLWTRSGNPSNVGGTGSWGDWKLVLDSVNYNYYSPSLLGEGASGNWDINVTGNAATATKMDYGGLTGTAPTWNQNTTGNATTATTAASCTGNSTTATTATSCTGNSVTATNVAYTGLTGTAPTWNQNTSGTAASFTGSLAGDVTGTQGATSIAAATVTGKALTAYSSAAGTITATDTILTAINKLNGNVSAKISSNVSSQSGETQITNLIQVTQSRYNEILAGGGVSNSTLYIIVG